MDIILEWYSELILNEEYPGCFDEYNLPEDFDQQKWYICNKE